MPGRNCRLDAANRIIEVTDRLGGVTCGVLDSDASDAAGNGNGDGGHDIFGTLAVAVLKIAVERAELTGRPRR
jgi:hypothetical protein